MALGKDWADRHSYIRTTDGCLMILNVHRPRGEWAGNMVGNNNKYTQIAEEHGMEAGGIGDLKSG